MGITHSQEIYQKIFPHYLDFNSYIWLILCEGQDFKFYSHYFKNIYVALLFFFLIIIYMLRIQSMCLQFPCGTICFDGYRGFCCWMFLLGNVKYCFSQEEFMKVIQPLEQPRTFNTDAFFVRKAVLNFFLWHTLEC